MIQVRTCCSREGNSSMDNGAFRVLVYGYGNPGRQDDGLGAALIRRLEEARLPGVNLECNYQLNIEDADTVSSYGAVIFADAAREAQAPYLFHKISPAAEIAFTTHAMSPESVLALCHDIHGKAPEAYLLAMSGHDWDMAEGLSERAEINLNAAFEFVRNLLSLGSLEKIEEATACKDV
jgi:hydrogenase maturation protease